MTTDRVTVAEAWRSACILARLPNSREARKAFYAGARHALLMMIDADPAQMNELNDQLHAFATETLEP